MHSVLVNRSKSSSEKSTGLSKELCRLGDRQESPANSVRSGSADGNCEAAGGADKDIEESRCSENDGSDSVWTVWLSGIGPGLSAELVEESEWRCVAAVSEVPDSASSGGRSGQPKRPPSSGVGCALSVLSLE